MDRTHRVCLTTIENFAINNGPLIVKFASCVHQKTMTVTNDAFTYRVGVSLLAAASVLTFVQGNIMVFKPEILLVLLLLPPRL